MRPASSSIKSEALAPASFDALLSRLTDADADVDASLPAPKTFMRYWDFSLPSAEVHPTTVSKYNTFLQLVLLGSATAFPLVVSTNPATGVMTGSMIGELDLVTGMQWLQIPL